MSSDIGEYKLFDFNCDVAQSYGVYKNESELEIAKFASSINISAGFHAGDPMTISKALKFASENNIALGVHIGYPDIQGFGKRQMNLDNEELEALIIYQISAIVAYAKTFDLEVEHVRCHGAFKEYLMQSQEGLLVAVESIKKVCPWLNLIVQTPQAKEFVEKNGLKAAYEVEFSETSSLREIRELEVKPDTIHFKSLEDIKRAYDILKPTPINYNRVQNQI
ncbi:MAG: LamB/YcsF family protein [Candidatus Gastranaerophilales bacterium]|nr:LamB/YcsF family protein [Candidatus Gastranaerophilales bacterium]